MNKISIFCDGGLGNRLSTLIGGLYLANKINYEFEIIWPQTRWCNCNFEDLYDENINHTNFNDNINDYIIDNNTTLIISHIDNGYPKNIQFISQYSNIIDMDFSNYNKIFYNHNSIPHYVDEDNSSKQLSLIKISNNILNEVKKFTNEFNINNETLGLHIRRTDSPMITSDDEYFNYINNLNDKKIFVCSDEEEIEKSLKSKFSNVLVRNKSQYVEKFVDGPWRNNKLNGIFNVNRNKQSVIDAFIDMLILSRTNILDFKNIGSFYQLSKLYKNIEL